MALFFSHLNANNFENIIYGKVPGAKLFSYLLTTQGEHLLADSQQITQSCFLQRKDTFDFDGFGCTHVKLLV